MPNAAQLAFLGCRLLSLYVLYQAVLSSGFAVVHLVQLLKSGESLNRTDPFWLVLVLQVLVFLVLWFGAKRISGMAADAGPGGSDLEAFSRSNIVSLAVVCSGVFILVLTIPRLIVVVSLSILQGTPDISLMISNALSLVMGIVCITGPKTLANLVVRARRW